MSQTLDNNKRIAKNTLILYVRMLFTVGISFYSTRLILANLGVENYGIYNVIGGFVSMFYMVTSTMTQAVSRFLTFDLGRGDIAKLQKTFSTSVNILLLMSIVVVLLSLGIAFALTVSSIDKLIYYGLLVFAIELCIQMMCWISPKLQSNIHWKTITIQNHWFVHFGGYKVL